MKITNNFCAITPPAVTQPGEIRTTNGQLLGLHQGLAFYTIGQRKGLPAYTEALYVLEKKSEVTR